MKNIYFKTNWALIIKSSFLVVALFFGIFNNANAQVIKSFTARNPVERIKGDFTLIGNHNITVYNNPLNENNGGANMDYVNVDNTTSGILNSSSANLVFSTENGANTATSEIKFAGLYWTGRAHDTRTSWWSTYDRESPNEFTVSN